MIQVKNRACVRTIAVRSLRASKMRNLIAVIAIMLTTMLFTALFTIAISINDSVPAVQLSYGRRRCARVF